MTRQSETCLPNEARPVELKDGPLPPDVQKEFGELLRRQAESGLGPTPEAADEIEAFLNGHGFVCHRFPPGCLYDTARKLCPGPCKCGAF